MLKSTQAKVLNKYEYQTNANEYQNESQLTHLSSQQLEQPFSIWLKCNSFDLFALPAA